MIALNSFFITVLYWTEILLKSAYHWESELRSASAPALLDRFAGKSESWRSDMLWTIFVIILVLWLLGFIGGVGGNLVHLLILVALIVLIFNLLSGRRAVL